MEVNTNKNSNLQTQGQFDLTMWLKPSLFKNETLWRVLLVLLIVVVLLWLGGWVWGALSYFSSLLLLFLSGWLIALFLRPVVGWFVKRGLAKAGAIGITYLMVVAGIGLFSLVVGPALISQTGNLIENTGPLISRTQNWFRDITSSLGLGPLNLKELASQVQGYTSSLLGSILNLTTSVTGFAVEILLAIIISVSLLAGQSYAKTAKNAAKAAPAWPQILPASWKATALFLKESLEQNFKIYLGGQLTVGLLYGLFVWLVMVVAGVPYAVTTASLCFVLMLIPLCGGPLSLFLPLLIVIGTSSGDGWIIFPVLFLFQTILLNGLLPKIVGKKSGLNPVTTLFVLLAGAQIGGVWGVILAVPVAGVVANALELLKTNSAKPEAQIQKEPVTLKVAISALPEEIKSPDISK
jgi:predicted PurR-regulated permease PerM